MTTPASNLTISVVICAYNEDQWIGRTLSSLMEQDRLPDEIIVVDNASTDSTAAIVNTFIQDNPQQIIRLVHEATKGLHHARETGWRASTGDVVVSTDADILFPKDWLTIVEATFINPDVYAVTGTFRYRDALPIADWVTNMNDAQRAKAENTHLNGGNSAVRRHVLEEINGYIGKPANEFEDQYLSQKIHTAGYHIHFLPEMRLWHTFRRFNKDGLWGYIKYIFFYTAENIYPDHLSSESPYKLSVVIPTHNAENTIRTCLFSLLEQEPKPYNIIIVNQSSTDNTRQQITSLCQQYPDAQLRIIDCPADKDAFTVGWQATDGDLIVHMPPHIQLETEALAKIHAAFMCNADLDVINTPIQTQHNTLMRWLATLIPLQNTQTLSDIIVCRRQVLADNQAVSLTDTSLNIQHKTNIRALLISS